jgi:hypothetical protein
MSFLVRTRSSSDDATSGVFVQIMKSASSADVANRTSIHPNFQARTGSQANLSESRFVFSESKPLLMVPILTQEEKREYAVDESEKIFIRKYLTNTEWLVLQREYFVLDGAMRRLLSFAFGTCLCFLNKLITLLRTRRDSSDLYFRMLLPSTPPNVMLHFIIEANQHDGALYWLVMNSSFVLDYITSTIHFS